jgi:hypothetical protein
MTIPPPYSLVSARNQLDHRITRGIQIIPEQEAAPAAKAEGGMEGNKPTVARFLPSAHHGTDNESAAIGKTISGPF